MSVQVGAGVALRAGCAWCLDGVSEGLGSRQHGQAAAAAAATCCPSRCWRPSCTAAPRLTPACSPTLPQLLKTLQQQTPAALLGVATVADSSAPTTPTGMAGLSPNSVAASALQHDSSNLLLQLQLMQQQQAAGQVLVAGGLHTTLSDASQHSGSSPGGSPRMVAGAGIDAEAARLGSPTVVPAADEATSQLARLIQQQQAAQAAAQQQVAAAAAATAAANAAAAGSIDPALLAALQNLGLGSAAGAGVPEVRHTRAQLAAVKAEREAEIVVDCPRLWEDPPACGDGRASCYLADMASRASHSAR